MRDNISEILERVLDRGIVIEWWGRISLAGIDLVTAVADVVVTSLDTYLRYANALNDVASIPMPSDARPQSGSCARPLRRGMVTRSTATPRCWTIAILARRTDVHRRSVAVRPPATP